MKGDFISIPQIKLAISGGLCFSLCLAEPSGLTFVVIKRAGLAPSVGAFNRMVF